MLSPPQDKSRELDIIDPESIIVPPSEHSMMILEMHTIRSVLQHKHFATRIGPIAIKAINLSPESRAPPPLACAGHRGKMEKRLCEP